MIKKILISFLFFITAINYSWSQVHQDWAERYSSKGMNIDRGTAVALDNEGNSYVTGGGNQMSTIKYNSAGVQQWVRLYDESSSENVGRAIAVDDLSNVYVTGGSFSPASHVDIVTIKYNSKGDSLWTRRYSSLGFNNDSPTSIILDNSGNICIIGSSSENEFYSQLLTIKYNTSGDIIWVRTYAGISYSGYGRKLVNDKSDNIYVTGSIYVSGHTTAATIKFDSSGSQQWVKTYSNPSFYHGDEPEDIKIDSFGDIYVGGTSSVVYNDSLTEGFNILLIKYNSNGDSLWVKNYDYSNCNSCNGDDYFSSMAIDPLGNIYISGSSDTVSFDHDFFTVLKYNSSGSLEWDRHYMGVGGGADRTYSIGVDNNGNSYVTGEVGVNQNSSLYTTIKYSASGIQTWLQTYSGPDEGINKPLAMFVDSDNNIYITGNSYDFQTGEDYATVKYIQSPNAPTDLTVKTLGIGKLELNWTDNSSNERSFFIQSKNDIDTSWIVKDSTVKNFTQWNDSGLIIGRTYSYKVYARNDAGNSESTNIDSVLITFVKNESQIPVRFELYQNYPNPFNPVTKIKFAIPGTRSSVNTKLIIYDISGKKIATLINEKIDPGSYEVSWDASNYASGIYYYIIETGKNKMTKKMLLLK